MRDHPKHGTSILGGIWGTRMLHQEVRQFWVDVWKKAMNDPIMTKPRSEYNPDQAFLHRFFLIKFCLVLIVVHAKFIQLKITEFNTDLI